MVTNINEHEKTVIRQARDKLKLTQLEIRELSKDSGFDFGKGRSIHRDENLISFSGDCYKPQDTERTFGEIIDLFDGRDPQLTEIWTILKKSMDPSYEPTAEMDDWEEHILHLEQVAYGGKTFQYFTAEEFFGKLGKAKSLDAEVEVRYSHSALSGVL